MKKRFLLLLLNNDPTRLIRVKSPKSLKRRAIELCEDDEKWKEYVLTELAEGESTSPDGSKALFVMKAKK